MNEDEEIWNGRFEYNWKPHEKLATETAIEEISRELKWLEEAKELLVDQPDNEGALAIVNYYKK